MLNHTAPPGHEKTARAVNAGGTETGTGFKASARFYCQKVEEKPTPEQILLRFSANWICEVEAACLNHDRSSGALAVVRAIASRIDPRTHTAAISLPDLAIHTGLGLWATRRALRSLQTWGLLHVDLGNGRGLRSIYAPLLCYAEGGGYDL